VVGDGPGASFERTTARKVGSVIYLALTALLPAAVVINAINRHWFALLVAAVATALLVPVAIAVTRQPGPAAKLTFPLAVTTVLGVLLIGVGLS
jgi:4-hydroxybenzoate polyprenyltransferase